MPTAVATIVITFLMQACKGLVGRVLIALGVGAVTATGFHALASAVTSLAFTGNGLPAQAYHVIDSAGIPWLFTTMLGAVTARLALQGLLSDSLSFWVLRRGLPTS